jgi:tetratricopeptide (TPR) repeat protein
VRRWEGKPPSALLALSLLACGTPTVPRATVDRYQTLTDAEARTALDRARNRLASGQRDDGALAELEMVLRRAPEYVPAHLLYQDLCAALQRDQRMTLFYRDLAVPPQSPVREFLAARVATDEKRQLELLRRCIENDPNFFYARVASARILRKRGQNEDAIRALEAAVTTNEDLGVAYMETGELPDLELAELKEETNSPLEAAVHYRRYLAQRPHDRRARHNLARLLLEQDRDLDEVETCLNILRAGHPEDLELALMQAALHWRRGQPVPAARTYQEVLKSREDQPVAKARALLNLGNLFYGNAELRDWRKARVCFREFLALPRLETQQDLLDQWFAVPHRIAEIEQQRPELLVEDPSVLPRAVELPISGAGSVP